MATTTLELSLYHLPDGSLYADARMSSDTSAAPVMLAASVLVALDIDTLHGLENSTDGYGRLLSAQLFADQRLREAWLKARAYTATGALQLRLRFADSAADLHALHWELLRDPETDAPIALHERVRLIRDLDSADLTPIYVPSRPAVKRRYVLYPHDT